MTRFRSRRLLPYSVIVSGGFILALGSGRPAPLILVVPFLVVLVGAAIVGRTRPNIELRVTIGRLKAVEGDEIDFTVEMYSRTGSYQVTYLMDLQPGLELSDPPSTVFVARGSWATMHGRIRCRRWGIHVFGGGRVIARDPISAFVHEEQFEPSLAIRTYPRAEKLRSLLQPHVLQPRFGSLVSTAGGSGLEFADIREFASGDERRHVNWKATGRRGRLHVNLFHPEWRSDIVVLLDTFSDVGVPGSSSLDLAIRAAVSVTRAFLRRNDRIGLVTLGGAIQWLMPGIGHRQIYRAIDSLMQTQLAFSYSWPNSGSIPRRVIPPGALIVALTPLADRRTPAILLDLHARGHDVAIVEISPEAMLPAPADEREKIARRLWLMYRDAVRQHYRQIGLAVSSWRADQPLQVPLVELRQFRRTSRRVHV